MNNKLNNCFLAKPLVRTSRNATESAPSCSYSRAFSSILLVSHRLILFFYEHSMVNKTQRTSVIHKWLCEKWQTCPREKWHLMCSLGIMGLCFAVFVFQSKYWLNTRTAWIKKFNIPQLRELIRFPLLSCLSSIFTYLEKDFGFSGSDWQFVVNHSAVRFHKIIEKRDIIIKHSLVFFLLCFHGKKLLFLSKHFPRTTACTNTKWQLLLRETFCLCIPANLGLWFQSFWNPSVLL